MGIGAAPWRRPPEMVDNKFREWRELGVPLSTTSNVASKMFDASLTQYVGLYEDMSEGGLEATITKMLEADPTFIMGYVIKNGLGLLSNGRSVLVDKPFVDEIKQMMKLAETSSIQRERDHVWALKLLSKGLIDQACEVWEGILMDHPQDILAPRFAYRSYFYSGNVYQSRDTVARVLPRWKPDMPLYGYLLGMYAFGLEETNIYDRAEKLAKKGLEFNPRDVWSTHALCHVMEMQGRHEEGISFLTDTVKNWENSGLIACHTFWHWAVYYIEKGDYQGALDLFDSEVNVRSGKSKAPFDIDDACSLLFRLEMEGVDIGDRWNDVYEISRPHLDDHILVFHDVHMILACLGAKKTEAVKYLMDSIKQYISSSKGTNPAVMEEVGETICQAFIAYNDADYSKAVDMLNPVRYNIYKIGGSHAQRDLFNLFLIQAALKSPSFHHHKLARSLLMERKSQKENAPMTDRILAKMMALHAD